MRITRNRSPNSCIAIVTASASSNSPRADGTTRAFRKLVGPDLVLAHGRVGEPIVLAVVERIGTSTVSGRARVRVRRPTRNELCLPAPLGAYPSYCAPENVSQEG